MSSILPIKINQDYTSYTPPADKESLEQLRLDLKKALSGLSNSTITDNKITNTEKKPIKINKTLPTTRERKIKAKLAKLDLGKSFIAF